MKKATLLGFTVSLCAVSLLALQGCGDDDTDDGGTGGTSTAGTGGTTGGSGGSTGGTGGTGTAGTGGTGTAGTGGTGTAGTGGTGGSTGGTGGSGDMGGAGGAAASAVCAEYCDTYATKCPTMFGTDYTDEAGCLSHCDENMTSGAMTGNTIECRINHLSFFEGTNDGTHCPHASKASAAGGCL